MDTRGAWGGLALALAACAGCLPSAAEPRITRVGPPRPERGTGCEVRHFPVSPPTYRVERVASIELDCAAAGDDRSTRRGCDATLADYACSVGADTVYNVRAQARPDGLRLIADLGVNLERAPGSCLPACSPGFSCVAGVCRARCEPRCEAGFGCVAGQCVALCNPPCRAGSECGPARVCVAKAPAELAPTEVPPTADTERPAKQRRKKKRKRARAGKKRRKKKKAARAQPPKETKQQPRTPAAGANPEAPRPPTAAKPARQPGKPQPKPGAEPGPKVNGDGADAPPKEATSAPAK